MLMQRLDEAINQAKMLQSRSQAENYIKLGVVFVNDKQITKPSYKVQDSDKIIIKSEQYVSRAALKLASINKQFNLDFRNKVVLDVGSSTGGFTDFALQHGAKKVIAVDVGTDQLHHSLRGDKRIELHEKTDIRDVKFEILDSSKRDKSKVYIKGTPDIVVADVSFISLRNILPAISNLISESSLLVMMCKPQFEAGKDQTNKGVIKNSKIRRQILHDFEGWLNQNGFIILDKADSHIAGTKGNIERFYKLIKAK